MKNILKIFVGIIEFVVIVFCVSMIVLLMSTNKFGYTQIGDKTLIDINDINISELDIHKEGELILVNKTLYNNVKVGDILYYYDTLDKEYVVRYGTVKSKDGDNRSALYVFEENPSVKISSDRVVGKLSKITKFGKFYELVTSTVGFLLMVILPILIVFIYQVYKFVLLLKED